MADGDDDQNVLLVDGSDAGMMLFWCMVVMVNGGRWW